MIYAFFKDGYIPYRYSIHPRYYEELLLRQNDGDYCIVFKNSLSLDYWHVTILVKIGEE